MTLTPHIDELACAGHGDCALIAPGVFTLEDIAVVTGRGSDELLRKAARACPAGAITLTDDDTGDQVYPSAAAWRSDLGVAGSAPSPEPGWVRR